MKAVLMGVLGINHQSPLIYWVAAVPVIVCAGNQSPIPFDILITMKNHLKRQLGINHQSPLTYWRHAGSAHGDAGNQSPIPFDILLTRKCVSTWSWESITNPL